MLDKKIPAAPKPNAIDGPHDHNPQPELDELALRSIAPSSLAGAKSHALPSQQAEFTTAKGHTIAGKQIQGGKAGTAAPDDEPISPKILPNSFGLHPTEPVARHVSAFEKGEK